MPRVYITEHDKNKLLNLINDIKQKEIDGKSYVKRLEDELKVSQTVDANDLPSDVVIMNSTVLLDMNGEEEQVTLVYPDEADVIKNKISVLSPIGTAILGFRIGDDYEWDINGMPTHIQIKNVVHASVQTKS